MKNGPYELVKAPENYPSKKYRGKYCYEHILVYWQNTGKIPTHGYEIHHINGIHRDNRFENLQLITFEEHRKLHGLLTIADYWFGSCSNCCTEISLAARNWRYKTKNGQKYFFCSIKCSSLKQQQLGGKLRD